LQFPAGSSELDPADVERVHHFSEEAADNAMIIVIGYASETGNVDDNRSLSSDRATAVARILDSIKKPNQRVQAAYLGQTDRFGPSPELNQVCEVWQIIPKSGGDASPPRISSQVPPPPTPGE
jgi:flagellar motor protein MotB